MLVLCEQTPSGTTASDGVRSVAFTRVAFGWVEVPRLMVLVLLQPLGLNEITSLGVKCILLA